MKVLDSSFLIDYESGEPEAAAFLQENADEEFVIPSTVYTEYLLGEANAAPDPDLPTVRAEIDWTQVWTVTKGTANLGVSSTTSKPTSSCPPHVRILIRGI